MSMYDDTYLPRRPPPIPPTLEETRQRLKDEYKELTNYKFSEEFYIASKLAEVALEKENIKNNHTMEAIVYLKQYYPVIYNKCINTTVGAERFYYAVVGHIIDSFPDAEIEEIKNALASYRIYSKDTLCNIFIIFCIVFVILLIMLNFALLHLFGSAIAAPVTLFSIIFAPFILLTISASYMDYIYAKKPK